MKKFGILQQAIIGLTFLAATTGTASAEEVAASTPIEDARAILAASDTEKTLDFMFTQLVPLMETGFLGQIGQVGGGAELIKQIEAKYPGGQAAFGKRFGELLMVSFRAEYPNIIAQAAKQYAAQIKPADLATIRAFMESRAGKAMIAAQPKIQQQLSLAGQESGRKAGEKAASDLMAEASKYLGQQ